MPHQFSQSVACILNTHALTQSLNRRRTSSVSARAMLIVMAREIASCCAGTVGGLAANFCRRDTKEWAHTHEARKTKRSPNVGSHRRTVFWAKMKQHNVHRCPVHCGEHHISEEPLRTLIARPPAVSSGVQPRGGPTWWVASATNAAARAVAVAAATLCTPYRRTACRCCRSVACSRSSNRRPCASLRRGSRLPQI